MEKKILFVCTGNTCRSTMAEAIARKIITENRKEMGDLLVTSAGIYAQEGATAANNTLQIARQEGLDLENFSSKQITPQLIAEADLILTMTNSHKQQILSLAPEVKNKVFLIKEYIKNLDEKEDYYQRAKELYSRIQEKQRAFIEKHKATIEELENRKNQLEAELEQVMAELGEWQARLLKETQKEREELEALERDMYNLDISDPFGQPLHVYKECYNELYEAIDAALKKIIQKANEQ